MKKKFVRSKLRFCSKQHVKQTFNQILSIRFFFVPCNAGTKFAKWPLDLTYACTQMHVTILIMYNFLFWKKRYRDQTFVLKFYYIGKHRANTKESKNLIFNFSKKITADFFLKWEFFSAVSNTRKFGRSFFKTPCSERHPTVNQNQNKWSWVTQVNTRSRGHDRNNRRITACLRVNGYLQVVNISQECTVDYSI